MITSQLLAAQPYDGHVFNNTNEPLVGVNIQIQGTTLGTVTDSLGYFTLDHPNSDGLTLLVTRIGFHAKTVRLASETTKPIGIILYPQVLKLSGVTVQGSLVEDITTPVTHTTLHRSEIQARHHVEDIPLLLNQEPGVYVSNDGGSGFGDSHIMIRGFDEKRIQVMVNNIPVNDPETKEVAWSNWSALPDATQTLQVQRGVGTSLYGSSAIGGAINIVTLDAAPKRTVQWSLSTGAYGLKKLGFSFQSGLRATGSSFMVKLGYLEGSGSRENSFYRGLHYYLSLTQQLGTKHLIKLIAHGAPQYHTLSFAGLNAASYATPAQFAHDSLRLNDWNLPAYGFGRDFNGNVHTNVSGLSSSEHDRQTSLLDALFMRSKIGDDPATQVGGFVIQDDRASLNNNVSHRPQLEAHYSWFLNKRNKLTSTIFVTRGLDYSDDVYPAWYIPRSQDGHYDHEMMTSRSYWGGAEVFAYRYYSDFSQLGFLASFSTQWNQHKVSLGVESRTWSARHAGEVTNLFEAANVEVPIGSIKHPLSEGDLFYDFTTTKPQATLFGHGLWKIRQFELMTNFQLSMISFHVLEAIPSNNNYPNHLDPGASNTHQGDIWTGTATWDDDDISTTAEELVQYTLWDYHKRFAYFTPRLGLSYRLTNTMNLYSNYSIGIKEPEIKHFYGFGAPQDELKLEQTQDLELGFNFAGEIGGHPLSLSLTGYRINFAGKLMQITIPEKANSPGYDYAGHTFVPVGDARYAGLEFSGSLQIKPQLVWSMSASKTSNLWGEPDGTPGAQKLYGNVAVAGVDFEDSPDAAGNYNQIWDEGGQEGALHENFVEKYGARYDVGMPQMIWNNSLIFTQGIVSGRLATRYFSQIYVLENNAEILVGSGLDDFFFTADDDWSPTLPSALITDLSLSLTPQVGLRSTRLSLAVYNLFNVHYWQRGDEFGVIPGGARSWLISLTLKGQNPLMF